MTIENMKFDFVGARKIWFTISAVVIILGLIFMIRNIITDPIHRSPLRLGIDFVGGAIIQLQFNSDDVDLSKVGSEGISRIVNSITEKSPQVQITNNAEGKLVHIRSDQSLIDETKREALGKRLTEVIGPHTEVMSEEITPVISHELLALALKGLIIGSLLVLLYVTIRMSFDFAVFAVLALIHDILVLSGVFALLQVEINSYFVAAALTIVGYSINDTIIIYDRIRENSKIYRMHPFDRVVNLSLLQTLPRSIITSATTLFTVLSLYFFGGASIKDFALALAIGLVSGSYSSIFNAAQLLVSYRLYKAKGRMIKAEETLSKEEVDEFAAVDEAVASAQMRSTAAKKKKKRRY
ncbi:protein translocase subunit SecF [bacterium]|nr:protein translocase subunit SecF [bacterium]MBU1024482.1 protein translocase subunit SecF [bacterium]